MFLFSSVLRCEEEKMTGSFLQFHLYFGLKRLWFAGVGSSIHREEYISGSETC